MCGAVRLSSWRNWNHWSRENEPSVKTSASCDVGVDIFDLDIWIQVNLVRQPVQVNTVNLGNMSHGWTTAFDDHLERGIVTSKIDSDACGLELYAF